MTDLRKAAEMALDALRLYVTMYPQMDKGYMVGARETLRQALTQPEFDTPESHIVKWSIPVDPNNFGEAFAQPEQEPTECGYDETVGMCTNNPCCEQAQPEQEFKYTPYGLRSDENGKLSIGEISQREWVGLTNEEIASGQAEGEARSFKSAVRWVEAKLKEKNT